MVKLILSSAPPPGSENLLHQDSPLDLQLRTLALHLSHLDMLTRAGCRATAAVGYCFGEFAAAVSCGVLSKKDAVELITIRTWAISHIAECHSGGDGTECQGTACRAPTTSGFPSSRATMLNVFCPLDEVRKTLACLHSLQAGIAIIAGPTHIVLSGPENDITFLHNHFHTKGVKCKILNSPIPFHSAQMDPAIRLLEKVLPPSRSPNATSPLPDSETAYVSGITGTVLPKNIVGRAYWLRHMRDPILFAQALETASQLATSGNGVVVDMGPALLIRNILKRGLHAKVVDPEELVAGRDTIAFPHPQSPPKVQQLLDSDTPSNQRRPAEAVVLTRAAARRACLSALASLWSLPETEDLLLESLHSLGIDSLGFVRLSAALRDNAGLALPASAFTSTAPLADLLDDAIGDTRVLP